MPVVAAAVCPHPPLLVPELAHGAAAELAGLRAACAQALDRLRGAGAGSLVVVGADTATRWVPPPYGGSFAAWGVPLEVMLDTGAGKGAELPLSLLVGAWLLGRSGAGAPVRMLAVAGDAPAEECLALGEQLAGGAERTALLVMGDGTARRDEKAPGYADPRAAPLDRAVAAALAAGDPGGLAALDAGVATELLAAGRAPWQVLAGAAAASRPGRCWDAALHYADAPYGVGYFVASWS